MQKYEDNSTFPADPKILWYSLTWEPKSLQNLQEMCFLRNLHKNPQVNLKVIVMAELATKKVGAEPGLGMASPLFSPVGYLV
uniref:Uncharacterized protein n=1 Tax=Medicago truncatula TaxID=3880 RepID=A2Q566_MEDTR|nr:hypothetical protein MtrDRAFT_AC160012g24v2 [Medicago truncatula]